MSQQKQGINFLNKVGQKMIEIKNDFIESCSSNLVFLGENHFQRVAISPQKLTLNFENALFLSTDFKI